RPAVNSRTRRATLSFTNGASAGCSGSWKSPTRPPACTMGAGSSARLMVLKASRASSSRSVARLPVARRASAAAGILVGRLLIADSVEGLVPVDEARHAIFDARHRLITHIAAQLGYVGIGLADIARLQRQELLLRLDAQASFQHLDEIHEADRTIAADVVDAVGRGAGRRIRIVAAPFRIRLRNIIQRAEHAFHNVIDVSEISA